MRFVLLYLILTLSFHLMGNCQQVSVFQTLTVKNGLPSNFIFDASEDENGFLWIATDKGFAKHDGFTWQTINTDMGLPGNYITSINCNKKGGIWLSVGGKGTYYYNIKNKQFRLVTNDEIILKYTLGKNGELYLPEKNSVKNTYSLYQYSPQNNFVKTLLYETALHGCDKCKRTATFDYQHKIITQHANVKNYNNDGKWRIAVKEHIPFDCVFSNNKDSIFFSDGILTLKSITKSFSKKIFPSYKYFNFASNDSLFYCCNIQDGFWQLDTKGNYKQYTTTDGLVTNLVNKIYVTKNKDVLLCTLGGGLQLLLPTQNKKISTDEKLVRAIDVTNKIAYVCTENKLFVIDLLKSTILETIPLVENFIESISINNNDIIIGSLTGINTYKIINHQLIKINTINVGAGVSSAFVYPNGYIGSTYGSGIMLFDKNNKVTYKNTNSKYGIIEKLQPLSFGYAGTTLEDGVHFFTKEFNAIKTITKNEGLKSNEVYDVHEYKDTIWISTTNGITAFTKNNAVLQIDLLKTSLYDKCKYSFHSSDNKYWVVATNGLYEFNEGKLFTVGTYPILNNIKDKINAALYDVTSNTLVVGTGNEIILLKINNIKKNSSVLPPSILFTQIDNNDKIANNNFSLPYNFDNIAFSIAPAYSNPFSQAKTLYKLEGFNKSFQLLKDSTIINFAKLRPGDYKLYSKTISVDDYESETVLLYSFTVKKPIWQSLWFILATTIFTVMGSILLFNYFQRKKQLQKDKENALALSVSKERERISKDLHDHLGTSLVTMIAQTDNIENKLINNNVEDALLKVQQLSDQSRESMNVLRETIWAVQENSHTLNEFTLRVRTFLQRVMDAHEMNWALDCNGSLQKDLSAEQTLHLFRMIQEVTQNILKHAAATHAQYTIDANTNILKITITDDGKGFDTNAVYTSNGLKNLAARIKELDGTINITSEKQKGTTIIVQLSI